MTWVRLDDGFADHPKVIGLSDKAFRLHVTALCYAARHLTDGRVPDVLAPKGLAHELEKAGLWLASNDGWAINHYLEFNRSRSETEALREAKREAGRSGGLASGQARTKQSASPFGSEVLNSPTQTPTPTGELRSPAPRARDALFDALALATGRDPTAMTRREARACGTAMADIRHASPDVTPAEIERRAANYRRHMPQATLTPSALANHWSLCGSVAVLANGSNPSHADTVLRLAREMGEPL